MCLVFRIHLFPFLGILTPTLTLADKSPLLHFGEMVYAYTNFTTFLKVTLDESQQASD